MFPWRFLPIWRISKLFSLTHVEKNKSICNLLSRLRSNLTFLFTLISCNRIGFFFFLPVTDELSHRELGDRIIQAGLLPEKTHSFKSPYTVSVGPQHPALVTSLRVGQWWKQQTCSPQACCLETPRAKFQPEGQRMCAAHRSRER